MNIQAAGVPDSCAAPQKPSVPDSILSSFGEKFHFVEAVEGDPKSIPCLCKICAGY